MNDVTNPGKISAAQALRHAAIALETAASNLETGEQTAQKALEVVESLRGVPELINTALAALAHPPKSSHPAVAAAKLLDNDGNVIE